MSSSRPTAPAFQKMAEGCKWKFIGQITGSKANKTQEKFEETYLRSIYKKKTKSSVSKVSLQLSDDDYVYVGNFNFKSKNGYNFSYEHFEGNKLDYKDNQDCLPPQRHHGSNINGLWAGH